MWHHNGPDYLQQMALILYSQEGVSDMIDDLLAFSRAKKALDVRLEQVLSSLAKVSITLNRHKCRFSVSEVHSWGFSSPLMA